MRAVLALALTVAMAMLACAGLARAEGPVVLDIRLGEHPDKTRFVVEFSQPVDYRVFALENPDRIVVELPSVTFAPAVERPSGRGLVRSYAYGPGKAGTSRIIIELGKPAAVSEMSWIPARDSKGDRLVLDLKATSRETFLAQGAAKPAPAAAPAGPPAVRGTLIDPPVTPQPKPETGPPRVVVIDPGHGGKDPGAISRSGVYEKEIALAVSLLLRDRLEKTGRYRVIMTRTDDSYPTLAERVEIARAARAELFISIHADSLGREKTRGASVYTLAEEASDAEAAALARRENESAVIAGIDLREEPEEVGRILMALAKRDTMNRSRQFGQHAVTSLSAVTQLLQNPLRSAPFRVLRAPDVPSALIELGFLSNEEDEALLASPLWQENLAAGIARAVDAFFGAKVLEAQTEAAPAP